MHNLCQYLSLRTGCPASAHVRKYILTPYTRVDRLFFPVPAETPMNSPNPRSETRTDPTLDPRHPPLPAAGERLRWGNLHGSSTALAVSNAARDHGGPVLIICADTLVFAQVSFELVQVLGKAIWQELPNFAPESACSYDNHIERHSARPAPRSTHRHRR